MFENVIGNKKLIDSLKDDIKNSLLPPSILLVGEPFVGKLTTALEIALANLVCKVEFYNLQMF